MTPQTIQSLAALFASMAAFLGGMYLVVTRPLGKRIDDLKDGILPRLTAIEERLQKIEDRLTTLERKVDVLEIKAWK